MDALLRINKHFGITVICNLHSLDLARSYCDRLVGMAAGRVVFDGAPDDAHRRRRARALRPRGRRGDGRRAARGRGPHAGSATAAVAGCRAEPAQTCIAVQRHLNKERPHAQPPSSLARRRRAARSPLPAPPRRRTGRRKYPELVFAIVPAENASGVTDRYTPFVEYLSKELGTKVTLRVANDYAAVIEGQRAGNIHIARLRPGLLRPRRRHRRQDRAVRHRR